MKKIKQIYKDKFNFSDIAADYKIFFDSVDTINLAGVHLYSDLNDNNFYLFDCKDAERWDASPIAQIKFQFADNNTIFIRRLEFINNQYKGKGVASKFIKMFENFCTKNGYANIFGEFDPLHGESEEKVKNFYLRNNYEFKTISNKLHIYKLLKQDINIDENEF